MTRVLIEHEEGGGDLEDEFIALWRSVWRRGEGGEEEEGGGIRQVGL